MKAAIAACASLLLLTAASAVEAQEPAPGLASPPSSPAPLNLALMRSPFALTDEQAALLRAGIARTAVDHHFADQLTGSLGFLCGLHGETYQGAAAMRGVDPQGRFLGAKLSLAFR